MKLANIFYRGRNMVATELAPGELVGIASLPGRAAATECDRGNARCHSRR